MKAHGGCHCGAVRWEIELAPPLELLACNCSICAKTGFLHLIVQHSDFALLSGGDGLTSYRFGTGTAEHLFCRTCGVKSFYQPRSHPDCWSVNFNCLEDHEGIAHSVSAFDGRNWGAARAQLGG